jgi:hypothetical protein
MLRVKQFLIMTESQLPSLDFIAGLVNKCGVFMWVKQKNTEVPVFQIKMEVEELPVLEMIKAKLGLQEQIYQYSQKNKPYVLLLVRKRSVIQTTLIPTFDGRFWGKKKTQFNVWKNKFFERRLDFVYKYHSK